MAQIGNGLPDKASFAAQAQKIPTVVWHKEPDQLVDEVVKCMDKGKLDAECLKSEQMHTHVEIKKLRPFPKSSPERRKCHDADRCIHADGRIILGKSDCNSR